MVVNRRIFFASSSKNVTFRNFDLFIKSFKLICELFSIWNFRNEVQGFWQFSGTESRKFRLWNAFGNLYAQRSAQSMGRNGKSESPQMPRDFIKMKMQLMGFHLGLLFLVIRWICSNSIEMINNTVCGLILSPVTHSKGFGLNLKFV